MADPKDIDPNDDPHIFGEVEMEDDGTADIIRNLVAEMNAEDGDGGGFDQPPVERSSDLPDVVGPDEGHDLLDSAKEATPDDEKGGDKAKAGEGADDAEKASDGSDAAKGKAADEKAADGAKKPEVDGEGEKAADADLTAAPVADLLDGVSETRRAEITRRLGEASEVMDVFKDHAAELERHNATPKDAMRRLVDLNAFAQQKPDEYLAWVSKEVSANEPVKALEGAAKLLGYKMVRDEPEASSDDAEFMTDLEKEQAAEIARLKAAQDGTREFGPDTPDRQRARTVQETLTSFITETDESGQPKRPHFKMLEPQISSMAAQRARQTGNPITVDDLQAIYDQAVEQARSAFVPADPSTPQPTVPRENSAAQQNPSVEETIAKKAASASKAQRASKNIDGTGQGTTRRPALSQDADIESVIRHYATTD
jgi:hypothetical protein